MQHPHKEVSVIQHRSTIRELVVDASLTKTLVLFTLRRKERMQ